MSHPVKFKHSCGAIFYTFSPSGELGVILGDEGKDREEWLPFKGCAEDNETYEQAAIREIKEESGGLIDINNIHLEHNFSTRRKHYHIGLVEVPYDIIEKYNSSRVFETRNEFREKKEMRFFSLTTVLITCNIHSISRASIKYYWERLKNLNVTPSNNERLRCHGVSISDAQIIKNQIDLDSPMSGPDETPINDINVNKMKRYDMRFTPNMEKYIYRNRVWRKGVW
jgi:ADP-ribose pyrophosphatase YjhB (NUDIX family)